MKYIFYMIIGIMIVTLPIIIYLVLNNDVKDFIEYWYFYQ